MRVSCPSIFSEGGNEMIDIEKVFKDEFVNFYFQNDRKFCFLHEVVSWFHLNHGTNIKARDIKKMLLGLGYVYENKHIRFQDGTTKSDRICYIHEVTENPTYPERKNMIGKDDIINHYRNIFLKSLNEDSSNGLYEFGLYRENGNKVLLFDNKNINAYLNKFGDKYNLSKDTKRKIATSIRADSEKNYIRQNVYTEKSSTIQDKLFYKYTFKE